MECFKLLSGLCHRIVFMTNRFYWGSKNGERKIHWIKWEKMCLPKQSGGLGFKDIKAFNMALLVKQGWRLIRNPDSLAAKTIGCKHFNRKKFLNSKIGFIPSYTWRRIWQAKGVLEKRSCWKVGNGNNIKIWKDPWLPKQNGSKVWSPPKILEADAIITELMTTDDKE
ncbi:uncharacterized mitochondrial protein AtMg00310-like [Arachis duranensis]|uniref:Uncharacterized mitochondrial protein AtMg00310-like n=1 Tax=Arachis duranensis TaxID=130453 RepID=A0A9C6WQB9_ARADU|nr:uncharacterized mitochondrial protein AtMg00310-like [Arachis duranensis]